MFVLRVFLDPTSDRRAFLGALVLCMCAFAVGNDAVGLVGARAARGTTDVLITTLLTVAAARRLRHLGGNPWFALALPLGFKVVDATGGAYFAASVSMANCALILCMLAFPGPGAPGSATYSAGPVEGGSGRASPSPTSLAACWRALSRLTPKASARPS